MGLPVTISGEGPNDLPVLGPPAKHRTDFDLLAEALGLPAKHRPDLRLVPKHNNFSDVPDPELVLDDVELPAPRSGVDFSQYLRTDAGNALAFNDLFGERLRFDGVCWRAWNGETWVQVVEAHLLPLARQATEEMLRWAARQLSKGVREAWEKHAVKTQSAPRLRAMIRLAAGKSFARSRRGS